MVVATVTTQPWWPLSPWLSPAAAWFIFFNAVVAAIAVMSSCTQQIDQDEHVMASSRRRLRRSASSVPLDQLRSFSLFSVQNTGGGVTVAPPDDHAGVSDDSDYYQHHCSHEAGQAPQLSEERPMVALETRLPAAPEAGNRVAVAVPAVATTQAAAELEEENDGESISLDEAYAMVQRERPSRQSPLAPAASVVTTTAASWSQKTKAAKGHSKRRRRREAEEAPEGKAELNARAELFIRQFREELKLQRLNSLLGHTRAFGPINGEPAAVW